MAALRALPTAASALGRNPVLFVVTGGLALLQLPQLGVQAFGPVVASVVSLVFSLAFIVVLPFVQGGMLAMANEAVDGRTTLGTFVPAGKEHYVQLLVGYAVLLAINFALGVVAVVVLVVAGVGLFAASADPTGAGLVPLAVAGLLVALVVLAYLLVVFFVQFYGHAIVIDDLSAIEGFRRSVRLVRANLLSVTGYSLVVGVGGGLFGLVVGGLSVLFAPRPVLREFLPGISLAWQVGAAVGVVVLTTLLTAAFLAYSVAFYRAVRDPAPGERSVEAL